MADSARNVYFIDATLADSDALLAGIPAGAEIHRLDAEQDGLAQVLAALGGRSGLQAVHFLTHGAPGEFRLGATPVNLQTLAGRAADFAALGASLAPDGDLLIYGCNVAQGSTGLAFLQTLAQLTGADVAASDDLTGAAEAGGDWTLEAATGPVEAAAVEAPALAGVLGETNLAPAFGTAGGSVLTDFDGAYDDAYSITVQPDGKILLAGYTNPGGRLYVGTSDFAVVRYNADGTLDTSFGNGGKVSAGTVGLDELGYSVAVQADGKIVVAGQGYTGSYNDFLVMRFNADGSPDTGFGNGGKLSTAIGSLFDEASSILVQPDGKILVGGTSFISGSSLDFALVRYNTDGTLDTGFDFDGKTTTPVGTRADQVYCMALQPDGKILLAGQSYTGSNYDFALVRYNSDGSPDASFSQDGRLTTALGTGNDTAWSVVVQPDGKILLSGTSHNGINQDIALVRYNGDGSLDTGFGQSGTLITPVSTTLDDGARSVAVQADGKILVAGYRLDGADGSNCDFTLLRYNTDGSLDSSFGTAGIVTTALPTGPSLAYCLHLLPDGRILVGGIGADDSNSDTDFALARYNPDGSLDTSFAVTQALGGTVSFTENGAPVVLDADVSIHDAELDALNGGLGSYDGALLTITRHGGASAEDVFGASGGLGSLAEGSGLLVDTSLIGQVLTNSDGTLVIAFTSKATTAVVNQVLRQITYANTSEAPPASVQLDWTFSDGNTGAQGTGGAQLATGSVTVAITAVNDAPTASDRTVSTDEDVARVLAVADFGFADADTGDSLQAVLITSLPSHGELMLDGVAVGAGQSISAADIAAGKLVFTPAANASGTGYASFGFRVGDGSALSAQAYTISIDVAPVRDDLVVYGSGGDDTLRGDTIEAGSFDRLVGLEGNDSLLGGAGNDTLDGGEGADTMSGGLGSDTYTVDSAGDMVVESADSASGGIDTVYASITHTLGSYLENLVLTGSAAIDGIGNGLANRLTGNAADNLLNGGSGIDTMSGGWGNDTYYVHQEDDVVIESSDALHGGIDTVRTSVSRQLGAYQENLVLAGSAAIDGTGNSLANRLTGNAADNLLNGGSGTDTMSGGWGNDTYHVHQEDDVVIESSDALHGGIDTVRASVSRQLGAYQENLVLAGTAAIDGTGNSLANRLTGNGASNRLNGGSGADTLTGQGGDDVFLFASTLNAATNVDTIADFSGVTGNRDTIHLDDDVFKALGSVTQPTGLAAAAFCAGTQATSASQRIVYDQASGALYYDADGSGAGAQVQFAQLGTVSHPALLASDFVIVA